jgi:hypothetical protein
LRTLAQREGIRDDAYVLEGEEHSDAIASHPREYEGIDVLEIVDGGWAVYGTERGQTIYREVFETEDEACSELLSRLLRDPTIRARQPGERSPEESTDG